MHSGNDRARNWLAQRASAAASASTAAASAAATRLPTQAPEHLRAREGGGGAVLDEQEEWDAQPGWLVQMYKY